MTRICITAIFAIILATICCAFAAAEKISASSVAPGPTTPVMPEVRDAYARLDNGDFEGGVKLLKEAAKKDPDQPPADIALANWLISKGRYTAVRGALEHAVMDTPDDPQAYLFMGRIAIGEQRFTEAEMLYQRAGGLLAKFTGSPKRKAEMVPELYRGLASTAVARGDFAGQQKWLEAFLKLEPKSALALQALGQCMFRQKNPQAALQRFKEARSADALSPLPEIALAELCQSTGDRESAKKWVKAALAAAPKDPKVHVAAGTLAFQNEQYDDMFKEGSKTLELEQGNLEGLRLIGLWSYFQKNYKQAELYFDFANKKTKSRVFSISNDLVLALAEQKDDAKLDRALDIAQENLRQHPSSGTAIATLGWVYYKRKMLPEAEVQLRKAFAYGKTDPDTYYQFARIRHERGYDAEAKQALEIAVGGTGPSAYRQDAKALLAALKK